MHRKTCALALALVALTAPAHATVEPIKIRGISTVSLYTATAVEATTKGRPLDYHWDEQVLTTDTFPSAPLKKDASITGSDATDGRSATATAKTGLTAAFDNAAHGTIAFDGALSANVDGNETDYARAWGQFRFGYTFTTDTDAEFSIDYALSGPLSPHAGDSIELLDWDDDDYTTWRTFNQIGTTDLNGTLRRALLAGHRYELTIQRGDDPLWNAPYVKGTRAWSTSYQDVFNVSIGAGAVPEPASWALMIGGVTVAGGALRTRRRTAATA